MPEQQRAKIENSRHDQVGTDHNNRGPSAKLPYLVGSLFGVGGLYDSSGNFGGLIILKHVGLREGDLNDKLASIRDYILHAFENLLLLFFIHQVDETKTLGTAATGGK